jgi:Cu/Ag efflux protein CusF
MLRFATVAALLSLIPMSTFAQTVEAQNKVTATVTIKAIDHATRSVTLRSENGDEDTFTVGPEVTRFNELKAGDTIRATYYESLVFQVKKPGEPSAEGATLAGGRLEKVPGGALGARQTMSVTVKAVDPAVPSITVSTADGRTVTRKIRDKKNLEGVKPGDRIDITYTQALVVNAESAK